MYLAYEIKVVTRQGLHQQVWSKPVSSLSKKYKVSDYALRKLCKELQIPLPRPGHWQRIRAGRQVTVPALPASGAVAQEVDLSTLAAANAAAPPSPMELLQVESEHDLQQLLQVPPQLTNPHKLIAAAKADIEEQNITYCFKGLLTTSYGKLDIKVSKKSLDRTFRLLDTLLKALQARGHRVVVSGSQTYVQIREEKFEVAIREKLKRSAAIRPANYSYDYTPTGTLVLKLGPSWRAKEWQDDKVSLESRLSAVLAYLEWKTQQEEAWHFECQKAEEIRHEKERVLREQQVRKEHELHRFKELLQQAKRWHEAQLLRAYIAAVEQQAEDAPIPFPDRKAWLAWAGQKADWYDPQVNLPEAF